MSVLIFIHQLRGRIKVLVLRERIYKQKMLLAKMAIIARYCPVVVYLVTSFETKKTAKFLVDYDIFSIFLPS